MYNNLQSAVASPSDLLQDEPRMAVLEWLGVLPQALIVTRSTGQKIHGKSMEMPQMHTHMPYRPYRIQVEALQKC